jgi:hypothetical protein
VRTCSLHLDVPIAESKDLRPILADDLYVLGSYVEHSAHDFYRPERLTSIVLLHQSDKHAGAQERAVENSPAPVHDKPKLDEAYVEPQTGGEQAGERDARTAGCGDACGTQSRIESRAMNEIDREWDMESRPGYYAG